VNSHATPVETYYKQVIPGITSNQWVKILASATTFMSSQKQAAAVNLAASNDSDGSIEYIGVDSEED